MTARTTVPLTGSFSVVRTDLDATSAFRLQHAQSFLLAHGRKLVRPSGVIRRALEVYAGHLANLDDPAQEFRRATLASQCSGMGEEGRREAAARFDRAAEGAAEGVPPEDFSALLWGPGRIDMQAVTARAEALADEALKHRRRPRKRGSQGQPE